MGKGLGVRTAVTVQVQPGGDKGGWGGGQDGRPGLWGGGWGMGGLR